jgi:hypothetical protein
MDDPTGRWPMALPSGVRMTMMMAALGVLGAACGGGGGSDASDPPPTTVVATTSPATTAAPPATTIATPDASPLPQPTAPSQTTVATATTNSADEAAVKAAVIAGYELYRSGFFACSDAPAGCDPSDFVAAGGSSEQLLRQYFERMARLGQVSHRNPSVDFYVVEKLTLEAGRRAELTTCGVDGGVVVDTHDTPGTQDDTVVDDSIGTTRTQWTLVPTDNGWRILQAAVLEQKDGAQCRRDG